MSTLDELTDVAPLGLARQSSLSQWSLPTGAQALVSPPRGDFCCHTDLEDQPWWELDLLRPMPLHRIIVANRSDRRFRDRARHLMVEVSPDGESWQTVHAGLSYFGDGVDDPAMQLELGGHVMARYIRLSLPERQFLHLRSVSVLVSKRAQILADLWSAHGFQLPVQDRPRPGRGGAYDIFRQGEVAGTRVVGLKIRRNGRLGNNFVQILNALFLARRMGLSHVWAPEVSIGQENQAVSDDEVTLVPASSEPPDGLYLEGDFFYPQVFGTAVFAGFSNAEKYALAQKFIVPFIGMPPAPSAPDPARARELAIHIRSGDIFSSNPHPFYVQPPLSYYTTVLEDLLERGEIDRVCIVSEDRANPCIGALESYLEVKGIPVHMQSGSLLEDVTYLRSARHLAFGFGTFGYGICLISGPIETLHVFGMKDLYSGLPNVRTLTELVAAEGTYIAMGDWKCLPEQLQMMLEHPVEDLVRSFSTN